MPSSTLAGDFRLDPDGSALVCTRSGRRIAIGDEAELRVEGTTPARGWLRFSLLGEGRSAQRSEQGGRAVARPEGGRRGAPKAGRGRPKAGRRGGKRGRGKRGG